MSKPDFTASGDVYLFRWPDYGIKVMADRFTQDPREQTVKAEITVTLDPAIFPDITATHLSHDRLNLTSARSKKALAADIASRRNGVPWEDVIEQVAVLSLRRFREGEPVIAVGNQPIPDVRIEYQLYPFLRKGQPTIVFGEGGLGKSMLASYLSLLVQSGVEVGGLKPEQGNVLYLDYEDDSIETNERVRAFKAGVGSVVDHAEIQYRYCHQMLHYETGILQRIVAEHQISMIVVDSLGGATGGQINDADINTKLFNALRALKVTALLIDHVAKGDQKSGPIGSVFKYNRARSLWEIKHARQPGETEFSLGLYHRKVNRGRLMKPIGLHMEFEGDPAEVVIVSPIRVEGVPELEAELPLGDRIDVLLKGGPLASKDIATELQPPTVSLEAFTNTIRVTLSQNKRRFVNLEGTWRRRQINS